MYDGNLYRLRSFKTKTLDIDNSNATALRSTDEDYQIIEITNNNQTENIVISHTDTMNNSDGIVVPPNKKIVLFLTKPTSEVQVYGWASSTVSISVFEGKLDTL